MTKDELKHLEFCIAEAIWMSLENQQNVPTKLVNELHELYNGGAKGRASPDTLTLMHYIESLAKDVEYCSTTPRLPWREPDDIPIEFGGPVSMRP